MRLIDSGTGRTLALRRPSGAAVFVRAVSADDPGSLDTVRISLTGDLVRRVLKELHGLQVFVTSDAESHRRLVHQLGRYWIAPPDPWEADRRPVDFCVYGAGSAASQDVALRLSVGPVTAESTATVGDPLAIRFALMTCCYDQPVALTDEVLDRAHAMIERWRTRVATWSEHPPALMRRDALAHFSAAVDDNLDLPSALRMLTELEDEDGVPPGAKFEAFVYVDRILALDLARDLGTRNRGSKAMKPASTASATPASSPPLDRETTADEGLAGVRPGRAERGGHLDLPTLSRHVLDR